ncbi:hypothetical protein [Petrachloros mirabilis]
MASADRIIEGLPEETLGLVHAYAKDVKAVFGEQLEGLLIYGSAVRGEFLPGRSNLNMLFVISNFDAPTLKLYAPIHKRWSKEQVVVPLFLTDQELQTSSVLFPLEFVEIQEYHRVLGGRDPFVGFHVDGGRLKDEVMQGFVSHVLRLRQRFAEGGGTNDAVTILLPLSITSLLPLLRGVQRVSGKTVVPQSDALIKDVGDHFGIDLQGLLDALLLKRGQITPGPGEVPRLFDRYLHATSTLTNAVIRSLSS